MIMLGVEDVARSAAFYRDLLGWKVEGESAEFAFVAAGAVTIGLNRPLGRHVQPRAGATELILPVASVSAARTDLARRGCHFLNEAREVVSGSWAVSFADPDGHRLTLFGPQ